MANGIDRLEQRGKRMKDFADKTGLIFVAGFHLLALFAIGGTIVWAASFSFLEMVEKGGATVEDILLLFIYLELGAMVGIYFATNHMPVRFLIYVALTALTRLLIGMVNFEHLDLKAAISTPHWGLVVVTGGILVLALSALVLRYASFKYPSEQPTIRGIDPDGSMETKSS